MNLEGLLHHGNILVKELADGINCRGLSFEESERQILQFLYQIGQALEEQVVAGLKEPTTENRTRVNGKIAVFDGRRPLRFRSRFGGQTVILRRCYKYSDEPGGWYPIDEKLGLDRCLGYSPLMSYLIASFGASEPYGRASQLLSEALGFTLSATAIQRNTEAAGQRIGDNPHQLISASKAQESCEVMVVEVDGTISPQITEKQGVSGRESLKLPTEWKQCNVAVIEKYRHGKPFDRWMGHGMENSRSSSPTWVEPPSRWVSIPRQKLCSLPMEPMRTGNCRAPTFRALWQYWTSITPANTWVISVPCYAINEKRLGSMPGGGTCCWRGKSYKSFRR